jgi:pumilio RNA-binding family
MCSWISQRILEHCDDESTQNAMMEEIMQSVVTLTEDQYGNYVIQVTGSCSFLMYSVS